MAAKSRDDHRESDFGEAVLAELTRELGRAFDLSARIGEGTLGELVTGRLRDLRQRASRRETPKWSGVGDITQVAKEGSGPLDFYYRPHLFPDMDPALRLGHELQFDLLPRSLPEGSPLKIAAVLESYCHLSGDLLGWHRADDDLFVWIADVSGHGVRAGLAAAVLYFLVGAIEPSCPPGELAARLNHSMLAARNPDDRATLFATGIWLRVRPDGRASYASSGHPSLQLLRRDGSLELLESTGPPVGLLDEAEWEQVEIRLEPGDTLCLFTDGVTEATDSEERELGEERLSRVLRGESGGPMDKTRAVYEAVRSHRDTTLLEDDLTFLIAEAL